MQAATIKELIGHEFSRNIGLISEATQEKLALTRVAVAGAGGVGGIHILTLARMGVGKFHIADLDTFERANISRQFGAFKSTIGRHKAETLAAMVHDINPHADIKVFPRGVNPDNYQEFLEGCDFLVDGIEFFEIDVRRELFNLARDKGIPALTAAPLGFGATLQVFSPQGMSFDDYFGMTAAMPYLEKLAAFEAGLAPHPYHLEYLDVKKVSLRERRGPAVAPACTLAASLIATSIARIVAGEPVKTVPHYMQLDMYRSKFRKGYLLWGGKNPLQKLKCRIILKKFQQALQNA